MEFIYPLMTGFAASVFGFLAPTMLSMTAVRTSIGKNKKAGIQFAAGAASVVFVQAMVAVFFANYLLDNPEIIDALKRVAIIILLALSVFFFFEARKKRNMEGKKKSGNSYFIGLGMASLNQLAIPFYLTMATLIESKGWLEFTNIVSLLFASGAVLGAFMMFSVYVIFAEIIAIKYQFIARNINYILSLIFVLLSIITAVQLFR